MQLKEGKSEGFDSCDQLNNLKLDWNCWFFSLCDLANWWMTSKNNRALLLYYVELCASFQIHRWIQTVWKHSIRVNIGDILSCVILKFNGWYWKRIGHLFYTTSSLVHHFKSISEVKLELQSRNSQFGSKSAISCPKWPWNLSHDLEKQWLHLCYAASSFEHHFKAIGEFNLELQSGTAQLGPKLTTFFLCVTLNFVGWPSKTIGHLSLAALSFVHLFIAINDF